MKLDNPQLQHVLAGEYVLGTLQGAARRRFERHLEESTALREAVAFWENALVPLLPEETQPPSRDLLTTIEARLGWKEATAEAGWRLPWLPTLAFALVAGISIALWAPWQTRLAPDFSVSVATEEGTLRWQFAVDKTHNWIDLRVVQSPDLPDDRDLELWLLVDNAAPISLGLLSEKNGAQQRIKAGVDLNVGNGLAISVEPQGGSPSGQVTGPVIAAELFPTA